MCSTSRESLRRCRRRSTPARPHAPIAAGSAPQDFAVKCSARRLADAPAGAKQPRAYYESQAQQGSTHLGITRRGSAGKWTDGIIAGLRVRYFTATLVSSLIVMVWLRGTRSAPGSSRMASVLPLAPRVRNRPFQSAGAHRRASSNSIDSPRRACLRPPAVTITVAPDGIEFVPRPSTGREASRSGPRSHCAAGTDARSCS